VGSSTEYGEFVPKHHDFEVLEIVRPKAQDRELQNLTKYRVTERQEHEASTVVRRAAPILRVSPLIASRRNS
jgi:hypothetical protein